eukprot:COSAG01_NODE_4052_length_5395_cov_2.586813_5_plen_48_part_01
MCTQQPQGGPRPRGRGACMPLTQRRNIPHTPSQAAPLCLNTQRGYAAA